jgi:UDP-3-O-[3-hydroxymyristoyl] glucosamine N-acyltransferase
VQITVRELAALVGGQFFDEAGVSQVTITGVAAAREAGTGDVTFFGNPKYLPQIKATQATAVLVPLDFAERIAAIPVRVENPTLAFATLVGHFAPPPVVFAPGVHPSAVVATDAVLGEGVSIQPCAVIEAGARIGARTVIGAHSYIGHGATIGADCLLAQGITVGARCLVGDRVIIHSGAVLGSDGFGFELAQGRHVKIPQTGIVQVDDDVEIGANTTIDRARFGRTWIGEGTKIDNLVMIAHNVVIGRHCIIVAQVGISGSARLGDYVTLAGQAGVAGHLEIGSQAVVAAQSGVTKSLKGREMYMGFPAMPASDYREQIARIARLPKLAERVRRLEQLLDGGEKSLPKATEHLSG